MAPSLLLTIPPLLLLTAAYIYYRLYPVALPGIPHSPSALRPLGDIGAMKAHGKVSKEPSAAMFTIAKALGSPIAQVLFTSFGRPMVVVDDAREAEDILVRRTREFDRSPLTTQFFGPLLPRCTIAQLTTPALRAQKRLWGDVMGFEFLRRVVAPNVHAAAGELVELWRARVGEDDGGRPFEVKKDFESAALDAIWVAILGSKLGVLRRKIEKEATARRAQEGKGPEEEDSAISSAAIIQHAVEYMNKIVEAGFTSVWPAWGYFWLQLSPKYRRFKKITENEMRRLMVEACERFQHLNQDGDSDADAKTAKDGEALETCAMDFVLRRGVNRAQKAGLPAQDPARDPALLQELLLLLIAILDTDVPYLDAFIEETLRAAATAAIAARIAVVDTEILGCRIPAGTNVLLNTRVLEASTHTVDEDMRSPTSRAAQTKRARGGLDGESGLNLDVFEPRRWLVKDEAHQGKEVFDKNALPSLVFGGGLRGCFGKRLAMQELRIIIVLLILAFEFQPLPQELAGFESEEKLFRAPIKAHVKLRAI
ncbi:cytochrome P450 [Podospora appendiculata]|uniref:Cytochrome P450 n=1 Tax=Podospora appendiculata TaxID=314037 RepID=A0AAE1C7T9_9PEZI|nr:cytochrome P450 [Podospora appendiculata]